MSLMVENTGPAVSVQDAGRPGGMGMGAPNYYSPIGK